MNRMELKVEHACGECGKVYDTLLALATHAKKTHGLSGQEYYDRHMRKPGDGVCPICGTATKYRRLSEGYSKYCSKKCAARDFSDDPAKRSQKVSAMRNTMQTVYGVSNAAELDSVKSKRKDTMNARYGVDYYSQHADFCDRYKATMQSVYGVNGACCIPAVREAINRSMMSKYGTAYYFSAKVMTAANSYSNILEKHDCELLRFNDKKCIEFKCNKCGETCAEQDLFIKLRDREGATPCSHCIPKKIHPSIAENAVADYVRGLGFTVSHYDRNFIGPYGADIVIEDRKVIIEYDGIHWHSELYTDHRYHLMKTEMAEAMGYRLVHVFSDEWETKQDIVKSRISHILGVGHTERIYARKCEVREVNVADMTAFLDENHIQGSCLASLRLGLYYNGRLVAIMTFGKSRFEKDVDELLRYCTLGTVTVVGGAGKLFAAYRARTENAHIVSYADRRYSGMDAFYTKLGFAKTGCTVPNYYYVDRSARHNRMKFQKHKLIAQYPDHPEYRDMTEHEIMLSRGMYRIYDCGNIKYELTV